MAYKQQSPLPMMHLGKKKLEKDNPPPAKVDLVPRDADGNPISQVIGGAGLLGFLGPNAVSAGKQIIGNVGRLFRAFKEAPKQYLSKTKNVPVIGKPGQTVKVPKSSKTEQVSYVNPRISMTAEQRRRAGY